MVCLVKKSAASLLGEVLLIMTSLLVGTKFAYVLTRLIMEYGVFFPAAPLLLSS